MLRRGPSVRLALLTALLAALGADPARADRLVPKSGKPLEGALVSDDGNEVVFNPYWSTHPEMRYEVVRLPRSRVKKVEIAPHPQVEVFRRLAARKKGDTAALAKIAAYAKEEKLKAHARMCYALALAEDASNAAALKGIGGAAKWKAARTGNVFLDAELRAALETYVETEDAGEREQQAAALKKAGFAGKLETLERMRRSLASPGDFQEDVPLSWLCDRYPGAVYTLFVPRTYDPTVPWPLIIGLHGGGADGKLADEVVGSGRSAMNFYRRQAMQHGYIVACPDALEAPWGTPTNEGLVRALLEEMKHLYNVDLDRVYMTGHSMGGFGTWALGPRMAEDLAAISPMAGGGRGGISDLVKTKTPIFIYHSDDDYVSVEPDRAAARQLLGGDLDFVYTELPGKGHGFPDSIQRDLFAFFGPRRRHDPRHKDVWPRSSFGGKVTKDEKRYLGDPLASIRGEVEELDDLIDQLRLGGGRGMRAADALGRTKPEGAAAEIAKVLKDARASHHTRACAARALGRIADPVGAKALRRAASAEASRDSAVVAREAAQALAALGDEGGGKALARGVEAWVTFYEDKVTGDDMHFSDWERGVPTLAVLVDAWASLPGDKRDPRTLDRAVVKRVLAPQHGVRTSERVPQDPSVARTALARATARAYKAWQASDALWDRLLEALANDAKARAAAEALR